MKSDEKILLMAFYSALVALSHSPLECAALQVVALLLGSKYKAGSFKCSLSPPCTVYCFGILRLRVNNALQSGLVVD